MNSQKWLSLLVVLIILYSLRQKNIKFDSGSEPAKPGYYSLANNYQNVSSLKLDIFKQLTADLFFILIIGYVSTDEIFSIENFHNSAIGKSIITCIGYAIYYELIQPHIINKFINF